ncbi:esterase/lipase family protein [Nocardia sp. NPDC058658]|uniref:esterase/lipase family protein n=1 Tax=Nocardia sp. NPDC058658 TaxID=3346580 RepID=UPI00364B8AAA
MNRPRFRHTLHAAVLTGIAALAVALGATPATADPSPYAEPNAQQQLQQLADYINGGTRGKAIVWGTDGGLGGTGSACTSGSGAGSGNGSGDCYSDSGSSSGSSGGYAKDTTEWGPAMTAFLPAFAYSFLHPDAAPPGTNDWNCKPTAAHPRPVILVHATWLDAYADYAGMSQQITDAGFCTFTFNYGRSNMLEGGGLGSLLPNIQATGYIQDSAKQLSTFVDRVLAATGSDEVDLIGHSQGGTMANWYTKFEGGAAKTQKLITFGATHHGTTLNGIGSLGRAVNNLGIDVLGPVEILVGHAGIQQTVGSQFIKDLNRDGDTIAGVDYTVVATRYDEITNPWQLTFLDAGPGATVRNITLQDGCEQDLSDHMTMTYSPRALSIALNALDPIQNPHLNCTFNPWLIGGGGSL